MTIEPAIEQGILAFAGEMTTHHHMYLFITRQTTSITGRKGILEVVGMNGARAGVIDDLGHLPGTLHVKSTSQGQ